MLIAIRENVAKLKKQGRSRDETVAAKPTAAFDAKWGNFVIDPAFSLGWSTRASDLWPIAGGNCTVVGREIAETPMASHQST